MPWKKNLDTGQWEDVPDEPDREKLQYLGTSSSGVQVYADEFGGTFGLWGTNTTLQQLPPIVANGLIDDIKRQAKESGGGSGDGVGWAQIVESRRQFDEEMKQAIAEEKQRVLESDRDYKYQVSYNEELLAYNQRKEATAIDSDNKDRALNARGLIETITARIERIQLERQEMLAESRRWNEDMRFRVDQENARRKAENIQLQQQNAAMLAEAQQNPADIGKVVSLLTSRNNASAGLRAAAERGESGITEESLMPIQELINTETDLNKGPDLATFNPIPLPEFAPLDTTIPTVEDLAGFIDPNSAFESGVIVEPDGDVQTGNRRQAIIDALTAKGQNVDPNLSDEQLNQFGSQFGLAEGGVGLFTKPTTVKVAENGPELITGQPLTGRKQEIEYGNPDNPLWKQYGFTGPTPGDAGSGQGGFGAMENAQVGNSAAAPSPASTPTGFDFGIYGDLQGLIAATTAEVQAGGPGPAAALMEQYTAWQSGGTGSTPAPPTGAKAAQDQLVADILKKLGLTDITEAFPIKASAPGTTQFQRSAYQGAFSAAGFGDANLFNELLRRNAPTAVSQGAVRRTG